MRLANGIPEEISYLCLQRQMGMSSVAGQWHSSGNWFHELASRILYELCGWPMAFLRQVELEMSYVAG